MFVSGAGGEGRLYESTNVTRRTYSNYVTFPRCSHTSFSFFVLLYLQNSEQIICWLSSAYRSWGSPGFKFASGCFPLWMFGECNLKLKSFGDVHDLGEFTITTRPTDLKPREICELRAEIPLPPLLLGLICSPSDKPISGSHLTVQKNRTTLQHEQRSAGEWRQLRPRSVANLATLDCWLRAAR
jgi:hypothetical protein